MALSWGQLTAAFACQASGAVDATAATCSLCGERGSATAAANGRCHGVPAHECAAAPAPGIPAWPAHNSAVRTARTGPKWPTHANPTWPAHDGAAFPAWTGSTRPAHGVPTRPAENSAACAARAGPTWPARGGPTWSAHNGAACPDRTSPTWPAVSAQAASRLGVPALHEAARRSPSGRHRRWQGRDRGARRRRLQWRQRFRGGRRGDGSDSLQRQGSRAAQERALQHVVDAD
mmetsp:Transcript_19750/g.54356  ORF Transcript_19750/g.54356 Transcript_19750/m.54356 type:complete len:233 (+) Transcript_19750:1520-2218(+)